MNRTTFLYLTALAPIGSAAAATAATAAESNSMPETLLDWAQKLVSEVTPANNFYGSHPTYVEWSNATTGAVARNRSVCSSFASHLLEQSFGYTAKDIGTWFGKNVPQADDYHATIAADNGFKRIVHVTALRPGDIIAIAYPAGSHPTGHVMIVASRATPRTASVPIEAGTQQYEIEVIDSANSGHGPGDTRHRSGGTWNTGVGRGVLRVYALPDDTIAGYAWSTSAQSLLRPAKVRKPAIGRLDPARVPHPSGSPGSAVQTQDAGTTDDDAATDE